MKQEDEYEPEDAPKPLTFAEQVSELMYAGKTLAEIARYTNWQMMCVIFLKRDKYGRLVRANPDLPPGVEVDDEGMRVISRRTTLDKAFIKTLKRRGVDEEQARNAWLDFQAANPKMGNSKEMLR